MNVWIYSIGAGLLYGPDWDSAPAMGYSGRGVARDNLAFTAEKGQGPIPVGAYRCLAPRTHRTLGPIAIPLEPHDANRMFGRSGFYVHGDNGKADYSASSGCIIVSRATRTRFAPGDVLTVIP